MKRTSKGDREKRAVRFAQNHYRRVGKNYPASWAKEFTEQMQAEWANNHPANENPKKSEKNNTNHKK